MNPYLAPRVNPSLVEAPVPCVRRLDVALIAVALVALVVTSFVAIFVRSFRDWGVPNYHWVANCGWVPLVFLTLYLWTPSPKLLAKAGGMFVVAAFGNAAVIACSALMVRPTENPSLAYSWAIVPFLVAAAYTGVVAWRIRDHAVTHPLAKHTGG